MEFLGKLQCKNSAGRVFTGLSIVSCSCQLPLSFHLHWRSHKRRNQLSRDSSQFHRSRRRLTLPCLPDIVFALASPRKKVNNYEDNQTAQGSLNYKSFVAQSGKYRVKTVFQYDLVIVGLPALHHSLEGWQGQFVEIFWF